MLLAISFSTAKDHQPCMTCLRLGTPGTPRGGMACEQVKICRVAAMPLAYLDSHGSMLEHTSNFCH